MKSLPQKEYLQIAAASVFAVAMGFLEGVVVVYLRLLYCPEGFGFPLHKFMDPHTLLIEAMRELSTLVMLGGVALLAASKWKDRFAYFLLTFALWDLFYYVFLKILLNWPASFQTFDVLFLIPWPWVGPVLAPVLASFTMILLALCLLNSNENPKHPEWTMWIAGSFAILASFLGDFGRLIIGGGYLNRFFNLATNPGFQQVISSHVPGSYDWFLFMVGEVVILTGIYVFRSKGKQS